MARKGWFIFYVLDRNLINDHSKCHLITNFSLNMKEGPEKISVYGRETRTTCAVEAYNGVIGRKIMNHANFFVFVEALQKEEFSKSISLSQAIPLVQMRDGRKDRMVFENP